jgi:hypothetical protein
MRRLAVVATLATALASCAPPSAVAQPTEAPPPPSASPAAETPAPTEEPTAPVATPVPAAIPQSVPLPEVKIDRRAFAIGPIQGLVAPSAEDAASMQANLAGIAQTYGELLTRYGNLPRLNSVDQANARMQFDTWMGTGPFADLVRGWLAIRYADEVKTVTVRDFTIERVYAKPWGRPALVEAHFAIVDRTETAIGTPSERRHDVRVRISVASSWRIIDVYDPTAGRWLAGDTPRYSPLVLEDEVTSAVALYLQNESYLYGAPVPSASRPPTTEFWKARVAALVELNELYQKGALRDRHFENVTVRITRFDPATFLGDGIVTVSVTGKLVEIDANGKRRVVPFTQPLRFLRTFGGEGSSWVAVDAQEPDGTWDSGGVLALSEIDRTFG